MTYDVITIKAFYMSSHTNGENFVSIRQAVAKKSMKVLCGQTNGQTKKQTDKQTQAIIRAILRIGPKIVLSTTLW